MSTASGVRNGDLLADRYRLERALGEGGMGMVYQALDLRIGRRVAVKFIQPQHAKEPDVVARFEREARAAGQLASEHVVRIFDIGKENGVPFIVMEQLTGEDLRTLIQREQLLPVARATELVIQACRGLDQAHECGIVHRDIKPENLFVVTRKDGSDCCKLLDFGVAKLTTATSGISKSGTQIGTISYMPPEQLRGESIDLRVDVYALGCVLYECFSGHPPFRASEVHVLVTRILMEEPQRLSAVRSDLPPSLVDIVHRALSKNPAARFESAAALSQALEPFARQSGRTKTLPGRVADTVLSPPSSTRARGTQQTLSSAAQEGPVSSSRRPTRRLLSLALAVGVSFLGFGLLARLLREPPSRVSPPASSVVQPVPPAAGDARVEPVRSAATEVVASPNELGSVPQPERSARTPERSVSTPGGKTLQARSMPENATGEAEIPVETAPPRDPTTGPRGAKFDSDSAY